MAKLEDDIDRLSAFDQWRKLAMHMRDAGSQALVDSLATDPGGAATRNHRWKPADEAGVLERAEVLKALLADRRTARKHADVVKGLTDSLEDLDRRTTLLDEPDNVRVLRSAKGLCALAAAPDSAFSASVMYFLYVIVREIYVAEPPDWAVGGARAGSNSAPNELVTWQCVRAIVDFRQALAQTAALIEEVATMLRESTKYLALYRGQTPDTPSSSSTHAETEWQEVDSHRRTLSFTTRIDALRDNIALKLPSLKELSRSANPEDVLAFISKFRSELKRDIEIHHEQFADAVKNVEQFRHAEKMDAEKQRENAEAGLHSGPRHDTIWSETAHQTALGTLKMAANYAEAARDCFDAADPPTKDPIKELTEVAHHFNKAEARFGVLLEVVTAHVSRALDSQLAAVSTEGNSFAWDAAEMAFSAAAYAEVTRRQRDERVRRAAEHLLATMSERGRFPPGRPIWIDPNGYRLTASNADVLRALARVLEREHDLRLEPITVGRMLAYFQDTQSATSGVYRTAEVAGPQSRRKTASVVLALHAVCRMLDERINQIVFRHFSIKRPSEITIPPLRDLFYGDYGLTRAKRETHGVVRRKSVSVVLERMHAHVSGSASSNTDPTFSLILHGPPGTGKTTLVESLAKSCDAPLVEVTPSDIVIGGADAIEGRARSVFYALSLLTRCVILFDEFDPILLRRNPEEKSPTVFSFLTPGMLPKLKTLHERAMERSVAYVLVTNLIGKLDEAAIRSGRFDEHVGVYPPDLLSRFGRLCQAMQQFNREEEARCNDRSVLPPTRNANQESHRMWRVVCETAGGPMNTLGKKGWFSAPDEIAEGQDTAFSYIYGKDENFDPPAKEMELQILALSPDDEERALSSNPDARKTRRESGSEREYKEWAWITLWDRKASPEIRTPFPQMPMAKQIQREYKKASDAWANRSDKRPQPEYKKALDAWTTRSDKRPQSERTPRE